MKSIELECGSPCACYSWLRAAGSDGNPQVLLLFLIVHKGDSSIQKEQPTEARVLAAGSESHQGIVCEDGKGLERIWAEHC